MAFSPGRRLAISNPDCIKIRHSTNSTTYSNLQVFTRTATRCLPTSIVCCRSCNACGNATIMHHDISSIEKTLGLHSLRLPLPRRCICNAGALLTDATLENAPTALSLSRLSRHGWCCGVVWWWRRRRRLDLCLMSQNAQTIPDSDSDLTVGVLVPAHRYSPVLPQKAHDSFCKAKRNQHVPMPYYSSPASHTMPYCTLCMSPTPSGGPRHEHQH